MAASQGPPKLNLLATAVELRLELRSIRAALERQVERLDRIDHDLSVVIDAGRAAGEAGRLPVLGYMPVAHSLNCRPNPDESAEFQVDGSTYFCLPPRLSQVLLFLASAPKAPEDALIAWRSREDLVGFLRHQVGRDVPSRYLNNLVHILKNAFQKAGLDRRLIQTHKRKGIRLALKHLAVPVIVGGLR